MPENPPDPAPNAMDALARLVFREALAEHYINGLAAGDDVELWLRTHGGWFPDPQLSYGDGTAMPEDEGTYIITKNPAEATRDARALMLRLSDTLDEDDNETLLDRVRKWLRYEKADQGQNQCSEAAPRDRSRSPRAGHGALDDDSMVNVLNLTVEALTATVGSLKRSNELLKLQLVTKDNRASRLELELATIQLETLHRGQREESRSKARD